MPLAQLSFPFRRRKPDIDDIDYYDEESSTTSGCGSTGAGGVHPRGGGGGRDEPLLSERDRKELMSLANENISMDFILEMKEAFQLFDKVSNNLDATLSASRATSKKRLLCYALRAKRDCLPLAISILGDFGRLSRVICTVQL